LLVKVARGIGGHGSQFARPRESHRGFRNPSQDQPKEEHLMAVKVGILARLRAKPGKENEVQKLLEGALPLAQAERQTQVWFAIKIGPREFGIFDAFPDESGRKAHLSGQIASALMAKAPELLSEPPQLEQVDVLAAKITTG
jgi:quinol monooxygenase YgiN